MLRPHLPAALVERARVRGADANSQYCIPRFFSYPADISDLQANKLSTVKKCLNEVLKYGGPFSPRDLYPVRVLFAWRTGAEPNHRVITVSACAAPDRLDA